VKRLARRRGPFAVGEWMMDSGAFTEITQHGRYRSGVEAYAAEIRRWAGNGKLLVAVAQDMMCEPFVLARTGLTVAAHQRITIERLDELVKQDTAGVPIMPVLQGYMPADYAAHVRAYGSRIGHGAWVGVGSVCKRNSAPKETRAVLQAILGVRPDLRLHGFGVKLTTLRHPEIRRLLYSADSMAWSFEARRQKRDPNSWVEAARFVARVAGADETPLPLLEAAA
jgi:GNAT superfamily N-acetyltransferase